MLSEILLAQDTDPTLSVGGNLRSIGGNVRIGGQDDLSDMTILTAEVKMPSGQNASISLLGPTRMDYEKAMSMLETVSETLDEYFGNQKGEQEECPNKKSSA